ncbi:MAG: glycosyltransferase family 2 protein [Bryobacteraceae bacterium]
MVVTVGIPFYNARATLRDTIRSLFAQTIHDWELILIDDGSVDESVEIARSVQDPRVRVISDGVNHGVSYRHNQIAEAARGKYIAKLDDDDLMHPERLERQIRYLEAQENVDLVGSSVYTISLDSKVSGMRNCDNSELTPANVLARCSLYQPTLTGRAEWFRRHRYDPRFIRSQDHELFNRTFNCSTVRAMREPLVFYREGRSRTINKYQLSSRWDRQIFLQYGCGIVGWPATVRLIASSFIKTEVYRVLWLCRLEELWIRRGRRRLDQQHLAAAQSTLDAIRRTAVPGFQEVSSDLKKVRIAMSSQ